MRFARGATRPRWCLDERSDRSRARARRFPRGRLRRSRFRLL